MEISQYNDAFLMSWDMGARTESQEFLLISDTHFDSPECDRKKLKKILDMAVERQAKVMHFGDWLDVMAGRADPRGTKSTVRNEYNVSNYFQAIAEDSIEFLKPYKDTLIFMSQGNHETNVTKRHEFDLLKMISWGLKMDGWNGLIGDYEGWVLFRAGRSKKNQYAKTMFYSHGSGGNSPVTRGVIQTNRRQVNVQADIFVSGHIHTQWSVPVPQRKLTRLGNEVVEDILHLQLGTFKDHKNRNGWEAHKGFGAPSIGGFWLKFFLDGDRFVVLEERTIL